MIKNALVNLLLAVLATAFSMSFVACNPKAGVAKGGERTYADFEGKRIGVQIGQTYNMVARDLLKAKEVPEYLTAADQLEALRQGRLDAALSDSAYIQPLIDSGAYPEFDYIWVPKELYVCESASVFHTEELRGQFNEWLAQAEADGTMEEIRNRWLGVSLPSDSDVPRFESQGENGVLRVCDTGDFPPFTYFDSNGDHTGMDYEVVSRFAQHIGKRLDVTIMSYDGIGPYVISGKADMSACYLTVTEERGQSMIFGDPVVVTQGVLIVPKNGGEPEGESGSLRSYTDFKGKGVAVITGGLTYNTAEAIGANPVNYNDSASAAEDVRKGRVSGFVHSLTAIQLMAAQSDDFEAIPIPTEIFSAQIAGMSLDQDVISRFNDFLSAITTDGTLKEMQSRWFGKVPDLNAPMQKIPNSESNGVLRVATCSDSIPYVYLGANRELSGYSVELTQRFGAHVGKRVEFVDMDFGGMIPYVVSGRADFSIACVAVTEERKQSVLFTEPFFQEQHGVLALKTGGMTTANEVTVDSFKGKSFSILLGTGFEDLAHTVFDASQVLFFTDLGPMEAVVTGKLDCTIADLTVAIPMLKQNRFLPLAYYTLPDDIAFNRYAAIAYDQYNVEQFNKFLKIIMEDGTFAEMEKRWIYDFDADNPPPMPVIPTTGENGSLRIATSSVCMPFVMMGTDNELIGLEVELMKRYAAHQGKTPVFTDLAYDALLPYIMSGKCDISAAMYFYSYERSENVFYTEPYYDARTAVIYRRADFESVASAANQKSFNFTEWIKIGVEKNLIRDKRWKLIVDGLGVTITIAILAQFFGTLLGCFVCWVLTRKNKYIKLLGSFYCGLIQGTPIVVLLMITYYIIFGKTNISNVLVAVAAFTIITGVGIARNLKGAIDTVDIVEIEAARSIGFSAFKAFLAVTLPQAVRRALPGYTNGFVELVKATAIVGYIAIQDLTRAGDIIRSRTYDAYFPLLFVAVIYLIVTTICVQVFKLIVNKINREGEA